MNDEFFRLKDTFFDVKKLVAFTGAGISSESGIPTYRGEGGLWNKYDPSRYANINYFMQDPTEYWSFYRDVRYPSLKNAKPNIAHKALVKLEKKGIVYRVITQNIDNLHQMAGSRNVIELHGNHSNIICLNCGRRFNMDEVYTMVGTEIPPRCSCGGILKPDVVFFGESLQTSALDKATLAAQVCDMFLVLGSSLLVYPASQLPIIAKETGSKLVIVNIDPTPLDGIADFVIHDSASKVLSELLG